MTESDITILKQFEEKLHRLKLKHKQAMERNRVLEATLQEREARLDELQQRYIRMEQNYNNLKQAKVISLSDAEIGATRDRLNRLVREIDRCIESLTK